MITALIGASVLCIAASAGVLVWGWSTANETLIWTSIGASGAAAVLLALAYVQSRIRPASSPTTESKAEPESSSTRREATQPPAEIKSPRAQVATQAKSPKTERRPRSATKPEATTPPSRDESIAETAAAAAASVASSKAPALAQEISTPPKTTAKSSAKKTPAKPSAKKTPAPGGRGGAAQAPKATAARKERKDVQGDVVAVADRKKFHRPECRHAQAQGAERISKAAARRRGYAPCGVCKP